MRKKVIWLVVSSLMVLSLMIASCGQEKVEEEVVEKEKETAKEEIAKDKIEEEEAPSDGEWWHVKWGEPEYGGTINFRMTTDPPYWEPYYYTFFTYLSFWGEGLGTICWTKDRKEFDYLTRTRVVDVRCGLIAESWEWPDYQTVIITLRKGIHFQNKPPVNGRELEAQDVVYHFSRLRGLGEFEGNGSPYRSHPQYVPLESVTATDKYTVVFKFSTPVIDGTNLLLDDWNYQHIVPRESVELYGTITDWENTIGTGPFMVEDYVSGSNLTCVRNPNYWQYDERYPENQLPYIDKLRALIIADISTAFSALRTGKLDMLGGLNLEQSQSLRRTNPELMQAPNAASGPGIAYRNDAEPFTDIQVRKALSIAIDRPTIAATHYGGLVSGIPCGLLSPYNLGYIFTYDEWPAEVKEGYTYDPDKAKQLLADAGYPNGFKTNVVASSTSDLDLLEIIKSYFQDINVNMEIKVMEATAYTQFTRAGSHDQMNFNTALTGHEAVPANQFMHYSSMTTYYYDFFDPVFDEFVLDFYKAPNVDEAKRLSYEADKRWISNFDGLQIFPLASVVMWQPYMKGYLGEVYNTGDHFAHMWIDQSLKKELGR